DSASGAGQATSVARCRGSVAESLRGRRLIGVNEMFAKILHANDGSAPAFKALELALALAKQNGSELHLVSVMEIDYMPEFVEDVRQETGRAARRFHGVLQRARALAERSDVKLLTHILTGHPVRDIVSSLPKSKPTCWSSAPPD